MDCEKLILELLPALRALVTRKLAASGMSQKDIAKKLNITQPAVSQYKQEKRGNMQVLEDNPEIRKDIETISNSVVRGTKNMETAIIEVIEMALKMCKN